ncbi:MAG: hypothetical protein ACREP8_03360 [Candidatus Binatia bacterium]
MSGLQQGKWRGPYEQLSLWDDGSSEPFVASSIAESPTGEVQLLERILERENLPVCVLAQAGGARSGRCAATKVRREWTG